LVVNRWFRNGMNKAVTFFFVLITFAHLNAQRHNIWYFGAYAGVDFNKNPPVALNDGRSNILDYNSTICDKKGDLLFYTDGMTVWNKNHEPMPNGTGLKGHSTAGQCGMIIPIPNSDTKYVIFQLTEFSSPGFLHYSVVDMSLNFGLGDVIPSIKNVLLDTSYNEKMCAYYNPVGNNYWVLTHKWKSNEFVAFSVDDQSIATHSVVSSIGSVHNCGKVNQPHDAMGQLTISKDGRKVINVITCQDKIELFDFDIRTAVLTNSLSFPATPGEKAFGGVFSPDATKIYVTGLLGANVYQYDLSNYNPSAIEASKYIVATSQPPDNFFYMELGPNGKLYVTKNNSHFLPVINNPNGLREQCDYTAKGVDLGDRICWGGLSRIAYNIPDDHPVTPLSRGVYEIIFFVTLLILMAIVVFFILKYNRKKQEAKARNEQLISEYKLIALKAQINPHFMSNCLAAIQLLIHRNETEKANFYVAKFGLMVRHILDFSSRQVIRLSEELELMTLYLELEQLRFESKFTYSIQIENEINPDQLFVPSLLLNPIVENAVWHGLLPVQKERQPKLSVGIVKYQEGICISIEDNGKGRSLNSKGVGHGKSFGTQIIQQRLNSIDFMYKKTGTEMEFFDLKDNKGLAIGTMVKIYLPYNLNPEQHELE
jgi:hypothetical protein